MLCRQEPKVGKNAIPIRDFEQAATDLDEIETIMRDVGAIQYGLWTNGLPVIAEKYREFLKENDG